MCLHSQCSSVCHLVPRLRFQNFQFLKTLKKSDLSLAFFRSIINFFRNDDESQDKAEAWMEQKNNLTNKKNRDNYGLNSFSQKKIDSAVI